jgi:polyphenol oxidase
VKVQLADGRQAHLVFTDRSHGDLRNGALAPVRDARRAAIAPLPWTSLTQVHQAAVVEVTASGEHAGVEADAAVTSVTGAVLAVQTADCAPIAVIAHGGALAVVHAGWRGLLAGVVDEALGRLRRLAAGPYRAVLGPCIHPECYEFSEPDLSLLVDRFGPAVRSTTADGRPAFDLPAAAVAALTELDVEVDLSNSSCTACDQRWFSHRARGELDRQVLVAWIEELA